MTDNLFEIKLSRVKQHFDSDRVVGIITAFRPESEATEKENVANNRKLASNFRAAGFGYVWVDGAWIDDQTGDHEQEVSILVIGEKEDEGKLFNMLVNAAKTYNQDAFVFKNADGSIKLYDKKGKEILSFDRFKLDRVADIYTKLRGGNHGGRSFIFESAHAEQDGFGYRLKKFAEFRKNM